MCLYQNIHAAYHYELLGLDAAERESHVCGHRVPPSEGGKMCPLHSCCRVLGHDVVFRCDGADEDGGLCGDAVREDVFVPLVSMIKSGYTEKGGEGWEVEEELENVSVVTMEFWPEDQPGRVVLVCVEEEIPVYEDMKGEARPNGLWNKMKRHLQRRSG
ncbi:hypothetical protein F4781DRAFT_144693 [Annulohypoxylon bovei var. microspora]|nr:hypothetical protein F4781DRAFT_144693 [Annulohypoxylon bovei var. microspora]